MSNEQARMRPPVEDLVRRIEYLATAYRQPEAASTGLITSAEVALIDACRAAATIEARKYKLFVGPDRVADENARDVLLTGLDEEQRPHLASAVNLVPILELGHTIRALTFLLVDAGGIYADAKAGSVHDALRVAIIHDVATS